jgi:hypothetical protein
MPQTRASATAIYPLLGGRRDLGFARLAGHGLGNSFFTYFHAVALAHASGARLFAPAWLSLKLGPLLRGEASKRLYWRMFRPHPDEICGFAKLATFLKSYGRRVEIRIDGEHPPVVADGALNVLASEKFTFRGLHEHRDMIRSRLLAIVEDAIPQGHRWGAGGYFAVHIRLGDFAQASDPAQLAAGRPNLRIPLSWYAEVVAALRRRHPTTSIYVFSDGPADQLRPVLELGCEIYRSGSDMTDLLAMAGADLLVGSNSTYSRWAAFLGNMPSIWLKTAGDFEKPSAEATPIHYCDLESPDPFASPDP